MQKTNVVCPLCENKQDLSDIAGPDKRVYHECGNCKLIFTNPDCLPSFSDEKERYLTHNNGIQYPGYVTFLNQAVTPALPYLSKEMNGLDYGCGPVPTLSVILQQQGYQCADYDPIFFPELPAGPFDFIFATECFEHFFSPAEEIEKIQALLKPDGLLVVMTDQWSTHEAFAKWGYAMDFTHVSFFHPETFQFIANQFGFSIIDYPSSRVELMKKI